MTLHVFSTPHCQNQNPSEQKIQDVKHCAILLLYNACALLVFGAMSSSILWIVSIPHLIQNWIGRYQRECSPAIPFTSVCSNIPFGNQLSTLTPAKCSLQLNGKKVDLLGLLGTMVILSFSLSGLSQARVDEKRVKNSHAMLCDTAKLTKKCTNVKNDANIISKYWHQILETTQLNGTP
eukprot:15338020-Ditylum_brightwellii.AAC.1